MVNPRNIYCIDSCSLIFLLRIFSREVFHPLCTILELLIEDRRLIAPREVFRELQKKDDNVLQWANNFPLLFVEPDIEMLQSVTDIMDTHNTLVSHDSEYPNADPFVVALALNYQHNDEDMVCFVVTEERVAGPGSMAIKIPNVCRDYGIQCVRLVEIFNLEAWVFQEGSA